MGKSLVSCFFDSRCILQLHATTFSLFHIIIVNCVFELLQLRRTTMLLFWFMFNPVLEKTCVTTQET